MSLHLYILTIILYLTFSSCSPNNSNHIYEEELTLCNQKIKVLKDSINQNIHKMHNFDCLDLYQMKNEIKLNDSLTRKLIKWASSYPHQLAIEHNTIKPLIHIKT